MRLNKPVVHGTTMFILMMTMLFDIQTAKSGAAEGLRLCIQSVIPSLFPFIFLSLLMTSRLYGTDIVLLRPFSKLGLVPAGNESILLMAFLGGYPVGAQTIANTWNDGLLDTKTARRLLGFCSNAGPSFIFGILSGAFTNKWAVWLLWLIHISSALVSGWVLPGRNINTKSANPTSAVSITTAMQKSITAMASICGWIIVIRTFLSFISKYLLNNTPAEISTIISGCIELTNGCLMLSAVPYEPARFIIASCLISCGGLCVYLQTRAVTGKLGTGMYLQGKLLQTLISFVLSSGAVIFLYPNTSSICGLLSLCGAAVVSMILLASKKSCSNPEKAVV